MGTGWRRALCTSIQRDDDRDRDAKNKKRRPQPHDAPSPRAAGTGGFFSAVKTAATGGGISSSSNPSTPTLRCRTRPLQQPADPAPVTPPSAPAPAARKHRVPLFQALSAPASPRSPSRFALLKASLLPSKSRCGVCSRGVKSGGSSAVFTAECSHAFHFPCIAAHARTSSASGVLSCPVCASPWRQAPFLASLRLHCSFHDDAQSKHRGGGGDGRKTPPPASAAGAPKLYDDDEPLLAPKAAANGGGFNPIPEADEDDDEEQGAAEFRGFFPRPRTTSGLAVTVAPEAALVSSGRRHGKYVVAVKVKAPGLRSSSAAPRRAPIDLVTVLDVSQGMMGEKLQMLKRGMRLVVASLGPADRLSIVAFSGAAKRLLPLRRMTRTGQRSARQIVDRLVVCAAAATQGQGQEPAQQSACVGDALRKATKVLEDRRDRNPVATVMLLSDTQQQQQQQQPPAAAVENSSRKQFGRPAVAPATRFTHVEIPIGPGDAPPLVSSRGARVRQVPGRAGERVDAGGAPGAGVPDGGDHGGVLVRARAAGRGGLRRRRRGERAAGRDVRGGGAGAAGGGARAAGQPPALAVSAVQLPRPGVAGDSAWRGAAAAAAGAPGRAGVVAAAARPVRGDARRGGVAAAGGAAGPGDGDPPAVVGTGAGAAVAADAAAAGAGGQPGHGAERHAVAARQPASGATDADVEERQEEGRRGQHDARRDPTRASRSCRGRGATDADVGVARGGAAGQGGHHAQVHEPGQRPARLRERALLKLPEMSCL